MKWSNAQLEALKPFNGNMLISAGAGSGKTQVLSQKVHDILASGVANPESILVVTFTVAAAFEMKQRIKKNLASNGVSQEIINKIDSSHIQTFDSFANFIVRKYASYLNISNNINILDANILQIKLKEYIDEIIDELYLEKSPLFAKLLQKTCVRSDKDLKTVLFDIAKKLDIYEEKEYLLDNYESLFFDRKRIETDYKNFINLCKKYINDGYNAVFVKNNIDDSDRLGKLNEEINQLMDAPTEDFLLALDSFNIPRAKRGLSEEQKAPFDYFKKNILQHVEDLIEPYSDFESVYERIFEVKEEMLFLVEILKKLDEKLNSYKKLTNSYTFNDIAKMCLKLFAIPEVKAKIKESFKFILVDEYQDTSDIQERFINEISDNNVYMVGDIKQSIYRFRFANCDIFRDKYFLYKRDTTKGKKVDLVDNFRSRKEILNAVNEIFSVIMDREMGGADYKVDHIINYGLKTYDEHVFDENLYGLKIIDYKEDEKKADPNVEIRIVANKIIELFKNKTQVYDKNGYLRPIKFSDIAILIRRKRDFKEYVRIFSEYNIPVSCDTKNNFFDYDSLLVLENIFTGVNYFRNNLKDDVVLKYIYTSIARSYLYEYSDKEIYESIMNDSYKNSEIFEKCKGIAEFSLKNSVEDSFNKIISEFKIIMKLSSVDRVLDNFEKIEFLNNMSKNFDSSKLSFDEFCDFFAKIKEYDIDFEIETQDQTKNAVQLMSNHKSKGLEWPIVFLTDISDSRTGSPDNTIGKFFKIGGAYFRIFGTIQPLPFYSTYNKMIDTFEESSEAIRIFYVALTRARETLYMVVNQNNYDDITVPIFKNRNFLNLVKNSKVELPIEKGKYTSNYLEGDNFILEIDDKNKKIVEFCSVFEEKVSRTASHAVEKNEINDELQSKLDFGIELHEYMETIDFRNPTSDYITNVRAKKIIDKILNMDVFKECLEDNFIDAYKEYEFIDDNLHGFVDLFLLFEDEIKIIDYKLKIIDKEEYKHQLKTYKDYLEKIFNKPCKTYLISLIDTRIEEIKHE